MVGNGNVIGEMDMMIAAHAVAIDGVLVTNNVRHYERIAPPLAIENWASDPPRLTSPTKPGWHLAADPS